ncbi:MAG: fumarylacetoacetate hydrolase family protein, partial [Pseudomonadales bacterium]
FGPCERLDYEMEVGIYLGAGNALGEAIAIDDADEHIFGMCLFNDWSARDIQGWEYQPLGPFLAKNFASTVSAWIVTNEALAPFRCAWQRLPEDPQPLSYLDSDSHRTRAAYDIQLQVQLYTQAMREQQLAPHTLSQSSFAESYWSVAQMLTHHTAGGCNMRPGDFFGSGTQSGPTREEAGSLLELSDAGKQTITLDNGEVRTFLEDGDTVIMRGFCEAENAVRIGFGECRGTVHPAKYTR